MATYIPVPGLEKKLADHPKVRKDTLAKAEKIAAKARDRTVVGATGRARDSVKAGEDKDGAYVTGGGGDGWHFVFQEVGGVGFRPPPMPLRRAAESEGNYQPRRR